MWKLACFDLDGTLVRNTSTGQHLAGKIGHTAEMEKLELLYAQGKITNAEVAALDGKHYKGYSQADVDAFLLDVPLISGIKETIEYLASKGIPSLICTLAWNFVAESIANRYGFIGWSGPSLVIDDTGVFTGAVLTDFHETDKPKFVENICRERGIAMSEVFHVGDSRSDIPLFRAVGFSIALNANELARTAASVSIETDSLFDVLKLIPGLEARKNQK